MNPNEIFVGTFAPLEHKPIVSSISLVLVSLYEIPSQNEMLSDIINTIPHNTHGNIMPWHASILRFAQLITLPVRHRLEIHNTIIIKILAGPNLRRYTFRMYICKWMLMDVPAAEAEVYAADESSVIVDDDELFMVRPVEGHIGCIFEDVVVGMAHDDYVSVAFVALGA